MSYVETRVSTEIVRHIWNEIPQVQGTREHSIRVGYFLAEAIKVYKDSPLQYTTPIESIIGQFPELDDPTTLFTVGILHDNGKKDPKFSPLLQNTRQTVEMNSEDLAKFRLILDEGRIAHVKNGRDTLANACLPEIYYVFAGSHHCYENHEG